MQEGRQVNRRHVVYSNVCVVCDYVRETMYTVCVEPHGCYAGMSEYMCSCVIKTSKKGPKVRVSYLSDYITSS